MAYSGGNSGNPRPFAVIAVASLHGIVVYALLTGLAVSYVAEVMPVIKARNIPIEPVPTPVPQPVERKVIEREAVRPPVSRPPVAPPLDRSTFATANDPGIPSGNDVRSRTSEPPPLPPPPPTYTPRLATPRGEPAGWVTASDYPARDLREGNQGVARFRLTVGADGKVTGCTIVRSSGFAGLDDATCRTVSRRARFRPATDETGQPVTGEFSSSIRWEIPEG